MVTSLRNGDVMLLENVRFYKEETNNDKVMNNPFFVRTYFYIPICMYLLMWPVTESIFST